MPPEAMNGKSRVKGTCVVCWIVVQEVLGSDALSLWHRLKSALPEALVLLVLRLHGVQNRFHVVCGRDTALLHFTRYWVKSVIPFV